MLCDVCESYCAEVWVLPLEDVLEAHREYRALEDAMGDLDWKDPEHSRLENAKEAIRRRLADEHRRVAEGRWWCAGDDGHEPLGPLHLDDGRPRTICDRCEGGRHDGGVDIDGRPGWDGSLDHESCPICVAMRVAWAATPFDDMGPADDDEEPRAWDPPLQDALRATGPADRRAVEAAVRACPATAHLEIAWVPSPRALADTLGDLARARGLGTFPLPWSLWSLAPGPVLGAATRVLVAEQSIDPERDEHRRIAASIRRTIAVALGDPDLVQGIGDAGPLDALTPLLEADLPQEAAATTFVDLMRTLRTSAGPANLLPGRLVISERPLVVRLDNEGRLHAEDGPALAWADGFALWVFHGVNVPEHVACDPSRITIAGIDAEPNAEVRRVMIERFGVERLLREGEAELVHEDETGRLWRRWVGPRPRPPERPRPRYSPAPPPEPERRVVMVEVVNSTPEPDGTFRTYFLRVPPTMRTAREAVAWTFQMEEAEYRPDVET